MDVHRCRFVPYQPSAINAVAFSHPKALHSKQAAAARLAIGRANGDIEIWNPLNGTWLQELLIRGGKDRSVDGLAWVNEPDQDLGDGRILSGKSRLFSIGYTSTVTEWDLENARPKRHASGQHGDIWCLAAQPSDVPENLSSDGAVQEAQGSSKLIAGTIDGELAMYAIEDDDLRFQRIIVRSPTKKAQMVSITFQSRKVVIVGCSDSTIRAYDIARGSMLRRMTLGADLVGGSKDIIVWEVKCLRNGNIVSGDSTGQVCIWDGKTYTQSQKLQSHKADVLSLATSADGTTIMSGGMDRRTVLHRQNGSEERWSKVWGRRYHSHDVKSMASFESGKMSLVVAGGLDSNPVVIPLKQMERENHRMLSCLPQQPPVASAPRARFIVSWWEREVHVWVVQRTAEDIFNGTGENVDVKRNQKLLKTIVVKGDSNITSVSIDQDGSLLVVSTSTGLKAFRLEHENPVKPSDVKLSTIQVPESTANLGASRVQLSPDGRWLCIVQHGSRVLMARVDVRKGADGSWGLRMRLQKVSRIRRHIARHIANGGLGGYARTITQLAFTADSKMFAAADMAGYVDTWVLRGATDNPQNGAGNDGSDDAASSSSSSESDPSGDEYVDSAAPDAGERWTRNPSGKLLPKLPSAPVVLSFSDDVPEAVDSSGGAGGDGSNQSDYTLLAISSSWDLVAFHPRRGTLTPWSRRNTRGLLPDAVRDLLDVAKGVLWQGSRIWVYGISFLLMIDMGQDLPKPASGNDSTGELQITQGTKRKRNGTTTGAGGQMARGNLAPHQVRKHTADEEQDIDMEDAGEAEENDSDEEMGGGDGELSQLRTNAAKNKDTASLEVSANDQERKAWWITYKYRPILGVVPLNKPGQPLEVALVERPTWDTEMPERYFSGEPWER